ncbi:hypothetical protein J4760_11035 [Salinicoccus sp. ID82-1]|uniref:Cytochrome b561 domain-containing protein n=1 Tax=Salinicoccus cyprini TaxID=2493691 RepID=A0A558AUZ2_9STAP|nr:MULTISPECIES: hypothetical protein [Salinicoccus]MCG1010554.1 hypothetical protein [Salinicoccus sp. ID82-1]TVT28078.1 hypothetical protein FO441_06600 [Salinicoccus cyprini]
MSIWFLLNGMLLIWAIWNVAFGISSHASYIHILLGFAGFLLFIFNWTRNAVFSTIRNAENRQNRIRLARMSKRIRPYHRWVGTSALIIILLHGWAVIELYGFNLTNMKILTGFLASINLFVLVLSGWYRLLIDPRIRVRKLHIRLGITMFILVAIHFIF